MDENRFRGPTGKYVNNDNFVISDTKRQAKTFLVKKSGKHQKEYFLQNNKFQPLFSQVTLFTTAGL